MGPKVVLDTNVFVSALGWKGASNKVFDDSINGNIELYIFLEIFDEIKRVLQYPNLVKVRLMII